MILNLPYHAIGVLLLSAFVGFGLSVTGFWLQKNVSATSFIIVNNLNKIVAVILGILLFQQIISLTAMTGVLCTILGGWLYPWARLQQDKLRISIRDVLNLLIALILKRRRKQ